MSGNHPQNPYEGPDWASRRARLISRVEFHPGDASRNLVFYTNLESEPASRSKNHGPATNMEGANEEAGPSQPPNVPASFTRAYTALRGPVQGQEGYPLAEWMRQTGGRTNLPTIPPTDPLPAGVPEHPGWDDDSDDVEGSGPSGRISPGTFLAFAQGAKRSATDHLKDPEDVLAKQTRTRPEGPSAVRGDKFPEYIFEAKSQVDETTGLQISPEYNVPTSPSMVYTPPGVSDMPYKTVNFIEMYTRMHPTPHGLMGLPPAGTNEHYAYTEVARAAAENGDQPPSEAADQLQNYFQIQYKAIEQVNAEDREHNAIIEAQQKYIKKLEAEREALQSTYIPLLQIRRHMRDSQRMVEEIEAQRLVARQERIREHLVNHVQDTRMRHDTALMRVNESKAKRIRQETQIKRLEQEIAEECLGVGKSCPQEVYDEVNGVSNASGTNVPLPERPSTSGRPQMSLSSLRHPVSVFEPGSTASTRQGHVSSDNLYDASPKKTATASLKKKVASPKGKWVPRGSYEFNPGFARTISHSSSMSHLNQSDSDDNDDAAGPSAKKEKHNTSPHAHDEQTGESSKQDKSS
ncbi:hypothetical protein F4781DRAFT_439657 [Annulohypoxylon bovei var. microspora]|nr:hypothetical protein F4781DRAFT_439657 [Annulohypoxylon bovei var. microspora]